MFGLAGAASVIVDNVLSVTAGGIVEVIMDKFSVAFSEKTEQSRLARADRELFNKGIMTISHNEPIFEKLNKKNDFYIPFCEEFVDEVNEHNPKFLQNNSTEWKVFNRDFEDGAVALSELLMECIEEARIKENLNWNKDITVEEMNKVILDARREVAMTLCRDLKAGQIRFNGTMFGVRKIEITATKTKMTLFSTDFYTNRVMNSVYKKLIEMEVIYEFNRTELVNFFYPFMTALGVDVIIELNDHTTMVVKRNNTLPNMQGSVPMWHVSMNEAISQTDYDDDGTESSISNKRCVRRGLKEELQIPEDAIEEGTVKFTDVYFLLDKCEIGIASTVRLKPCITQELVRYSHYGAKDSMLESKKEMKPVLLTRRGINAFIKVNDAVITESCRYVFTMIRCRLGREDYK